MDASLRDFYQKKLQRLEFDNLQLQEQLFTRPPDQYRLKYELLLEKSAQEKQIRQSKVSQQQTNKEQGLKERQQKWESTLKEKTKELKIIIENLQQENKRLTIRNTDLELKSVRLQKQLDQGDTDVIRLKFQGVKKENERIRKQLQQTYTQCQKKVSEVRKQIQDKVQNTKERQKISYRSQIQQLQLQITQLQQTLVQTEKKASPERQTNLQEFQKQLIRQKQQQSQQIRKVSALLEKRDKQINELHSQLQKQTECHVTTLRDLNNQLKEYQAQLFMKNYQKQTQLGELQRQMEKKRQNQADDLKQQIRRNQETFERQRSEWKLIIDQFQTENNKIKKDREDQKKKFTEEKKKLKEKINELRERLRDKQEEMNKAQNQKLLKSLKELDEGQQNFASYENAITFMDRQVRKYAIRIQQKDSEINSLLEELQLLQKQSQKQIAQVRQRSREEIKVLYDKLFNAEDQCDKMSVELKEKEKQVKKRQKDRQLDKENHEIELENLKKMMEEMQRDYERVTSNRKSLEDSYREERQNVITGKVDVNQERKNKYKDLHRQKREIELAYKQKIEQIHQQYETELEKLKRQKHQINTQREQLRAENQTLKDKMGLEKDNNLEDRYSDYQAKLATLDLEISLTQNLFKNLTNTIARGSSQKKGQIVQMKEEQSEDLSQGQPPNFRQPGEFGGDITTIYRPVQMPSEELSLKGPGAFSFFPSKK